MKDRILRLVLKRKWFDMILRGDKKEEYRDPTDYWNARLMQARMWAKEFDSVVFYHGYRKNRDWFQVKFEGLDLGEGLPEWGAEKGKEYFIIKLGDLEKCETRYPTQESDK